ncbi:uroporphyrinogen III [Mangrovimicrobium sediminis]|uniref:Uroporphyrinogen III n=1 Tax=Mangrovimicrobium sediminis TaxID=2562682 RepID=A0A4Z0M301_9GAMM|nr:uroporphyrinogen-III C-methyltransferase [Haliea sp. SAOS-164]TGD73881.1 uroporphyrinogen III [Haliea sp. SAOS-164]
MSEKDNNGQVQDGDLTEPEATGAGDSSVASEPPPASAAAPEPAVSAAATASSAAAQPAAAMSGSNVGGNGGGKDGGKSGSSLPGWLALVLVLLVAGALGWSLQQALQRESQLSERVAQLEADAGGGNTELAETESRLRDAIAAARRSADGERATQAGKLDALSRRIESQAQLLDSISATDENSWLRAEAQYLLRLANQRVLMARDPQSALALLHSADGILAELDDPGLHEVRAAVAAEIADLNALPRVDVEGVYLRLSALIEQAGKLRIFEMPEVAPRSDSDEPAQDWKVRLRRGYEQALQKLSDYIVIRRRDVPMQALMDPQWEGLVRQNLRMLLEQSQVALLSGNQELYEASLGRARHWVAQFADTDAAAAQAMDTELQALAALTVQVDMPDISRSLRALDAAIRRNPQGGAE